MCFTKVPEGGIEGSRRRVAGSGVLPASLTTLAEAQAAPSRLPASSPCRPLSSLRWTSPRGTWGPAWPPSRWGDRAPSWRPTCGLLLGRGRSAPPTRRRFPEAVTGYSVPCQHRAACTHTEPLSSGPVRHHRTPGRTQAGSRVRGAQPGPGAGPVNRRGRQAQGPSPPLLLKASACSPCRPLMPSSHGAGGTVQTAGSWGCRPRAPTLCRNTCLEVGPVGAGAGARPGVGGRGWW